MFFQQVIGSTCQNLTYAPYVQSYSCFAAAFASNTDAKVIQVGKAVLPKDGPPFEHPKIKFLERVTFFAAGVVMMIPLLNTIVHIALLTFRGFHGFWCTTGKDVATFSFVFRNILHSVPQRLTPVIKKLFGEECAKHVTVFYRKKDENTVEAVLTYGDKSSVIDMKGTGEYWIEIISMKFLEQFIKDQLTKLESLIENATKKENIKQELDALSAEVVKICKYCGAPDLFNLRLGENEILVGEKGSLPIRDSLKDTFYPIKSSLIHELLEFLSEGK